MQLFIFFHLGRKFEWLYPTIVQICTNINIYEKPSHQIYIEAVQ